MGSFAYDVSDEVNQRWSPVYRLLVNVQAEGLPLEGALVKIHCAGITTVPPVQQQRTDAAGNAVFTVGAGTVGLHAAYPGYSYVPTEQTVDGTDTGALGITMLRAPA